MIFLSKLCDVLCVVLKPFNFIELFNLQSMQQLKQENPSKRLNYT